MSPRRKSDAADIENSDLQVADADKPVSGSKKAKKEKPAVVDISGIKLDGEDEDNVPVYDSCDEIRRKINAFLKTGEMTQKQFLEEIGKVNSNSFGRFMKMKGQDAGASNGTYYGAYVFFEKRRIALKKPKGKRRLENEAANGPEGLPLVQSRGMWVLGPSKSSRSKRVSLPETDSGWVGDLW